MPRIRTIKPEFWGDEKLSPMPPIDRLVFLGLISMADDAGRIVDNVKSIDGFIFPESSDSSRNSLDSLARSSRILRYDSESGQKLIQIRNWEKHQKVDKPSRYVLPAPTEAQLSRESVANISRESRVPTLDLRPTTYDLGPATDDRGAQSTDRTAVSDFRVPLEQRMATDVDRVALSNLLGAVPNERAWCAEMLASLDAMGGHVALTPEQLGLAVRDFVANGGLKDPNMRHFRAYLARSAKAPVHSASLGSVEDRARLILAIANTHGLMSYIGNADDYARRREQAAADPRAFPGFLEITAKLDLSHGIGTQPEPFALKELVRRLESAPANGVHA